MSVHAKQQIVESGRAPMASGVRHAFALNIRPDQMLELFHDAIPSAPVPFDANFEVLGMEQKGMDSFIDFHYSSPSAPGTSCRCMDVLSGFISPIQNKCVPYGMTVQEFFYFLKRMADGLIPLDAEVDGIEVSASFTIILLRVKTDHFVPHNGTQLPHAHLRYEYGELALVNTFEAMAKDRRIQISSKR